MRKGQDLESDIELILGETSDEWYCKRFREVLKDPEQFFDVAGHQRPLLHFTADKNNFGFGGGFRLMEIDRCYRKSCVEKRSRNLTIILRMVI